jgi:hypothetical protein
MSPQHLFTNKKSWTDFSTDERRLITAIGVAQLALLGTALWDLRRRPAHLVRGSKKLWTPVVFVNFIGPITYFLFGRRPGATAR